MPSVNTPKSGHAGPAPLPGGHQYLPYTDTKFVAVLNDALAIIQDKIKGYKACDEAFKALPGGRSFSAVFMDPAVWINFDPTRRLKDYGATRGNDITITAYSLAMGRWTVAATLVHEMAHVNGAPGDTHAAEATLRHCLLKDLENPAIIGEIIQSTRFRIA
jgi:hypothetical protein